MTEDRIRAAAGKAAPFTVLMILAWLASSLAGMFFSQSVSLCDAQLTDSLFRLRYSLLGKEKTSTYLVHVLMDDRSLETADGHYAERDTVASLIRILAAEGADPIALDILYQHPRPDREDGALTGSVRAAQNVILPMILLEDRPMADGIKPIVLDRTRLAAGDGDDPRTRSFIAPFPQLESAANGMGHVNCSPDRDGRNRSFPIVRYSGEFNIPSLPLAAVCAFLGVKEENIIVRPGESVILKNATLPGKRVRDITIPIDAEGRVLLNHVGPWMDSFTAISAADIIAARDDEVLEAQVRDIVHGALVLISDVSSRNKDNGIGVFDPVVPNAEILLTVMNMILTERFLTSSDPLILIVMLVSLSVFLIISVSSMKSALPVISFCFAGFVLYIAFGILFFLYSGITVPMIVPLLAFLLYGLFSSLRQFGIQKKTISEYGTLISGEREERERLTREVEAARGERAIRHITERVMHDLRNLLQSIPSPLVPSAGTRRGEKSRQGSPAATAASIRKITEIAEDLLFHMQKEEGRLKAVVRETDLCSLASECLAACSAEAERKGIRYRFLPSRDPVILYCDGPKVSRILMNLIHNAVKFTQPGGSVNVTIVEPVSYDESLYPWKWDRPKPGYVASVKVEDTGCGIAKKNMEAVFSRFTRLPHADANVRDGFGLGLAIARNFAELHCGHVSIESEEGRGSVFTLFLPAGTGHVPVEEISSDRGAAGKPVDTARPEPSNEPEPTVPEAAAAVCGPDGTGLGRVRTFGFDEADRKPGPPVIVVDDEIAILEQFRILLAENGYRTFALCRDGADVIGLLRDLGASVLVVFLDLGMPGLSGADLFTEIRRLFPELKIVIVTGRNDAEGAVSFMKRGAYDYVTKPFERERILAVLAHAKKEQAEIRRLVNFSNGNNREILAHPEYFGEIVTNNRRMIDKLSIIERNAGKSITFLVQGESGVGKELIARAIHFASGRKGPFIPVNIGGISRELLNSTLFGYKKGAFTGADRDADGLIAAAEGGTLFLDEIGELQVETQVHLLRLLQEREYYRLGSNATVKADIRIVAATNANLKGRIESGRFREDLYYRLAECELVIPPLRERKDDIPLLARHFHGKHIGNRRPEEYSRELLSLMVSYAYPGNVRELESIVKLAIDDEDPSKLLANVVRESLRGQSGPDSRVLHDGTDDRQVITYSGPFPTMETLRDCFFEEALRQSNGDVPAAAVLLGINKTTFYRWLKERKRKQ